MNFTALGHSTLTVVLVALKSLSLWTVLELFQWSVYWTPRKPIERQFHHHLNVKNYFLRKDARDLTESCFSTRGWFLTELSKSLFSNRSQICRRILRLFLSRELQGFSQGFREKISLLLNWIRTLLNFFESSSEFHLNSSKFWSLNLKIRGRSAVSSKDWDPRNSQKCSVTRNVLIKIYSSLRFISHKLIEFVDGLLKFRAFRASTLNQSRSIAICLQISQKFNNFRNPTDHTRTRDSLWSARTGQILWEIFLKRKIYWNQGQVISGISAIHRHVPTRQLRLASLVRARISK